MPVPKCLRDQCLHCHPKTTRAGGGDSTRTGQLLRKPGPGSHPSYMGLEGGRFTSKGAVLRPSTVTCTQSGIHTNAAPDVLAFFQGGPHLPPGMATTGMPAGPRRAQRCCPPEGDTQGELNRKSSHSQSTRVLLASQDSSATG